jgi:anti-sigma factor ChrR (cupin superfamily)
MSEVFQRSGAAAISAPASGSHYCDTGALRWQPSGSEGFWIKPLFENPSTGERTMLMRVDPGAFAPLHAHAEIEQIYVLEGAFYDHNREVRAGDFVCRAPGDPHSSGSREGALALVVYLRAARGEQALADR